MVLALIDSTSMGTLEIPLILLVVGEGGARRTAARTLLFLLVIGVFYLLLGIGLLAGLLPMLEHVGHVLESSAAKVVLVVIGVLLVLWSHRADPAEVRKRGGDPEASARRWTARARRASGNPGMLIGLALVAGLLEAASMIPYLAATGIIADLGIGLGRGSLVLLGYCAVMIGPGALLCGVRALLDARADALLDRIHDRAVRYAASAFSWAIGIIGVILLLNSAPDVTALVTGR